MKIFGAVTGLVILALYVIGSGLWVNTGDNWYRSLNQPSWQPPGFIFGIIWPYNFIILGIAAVTIAQKASTAMSFIYLTFFAITVACALTWAFQFYQPHNLQIASIALVGTALFTIPMVIIVFRTSTPIAFALLPYQAWVAIAATLSYQYSQLN
jgi:tryptophan-rich sensory protein